eukprot:12900238-Prorocentrum_lima.AAC.1
MACRQQYSLRSVAVPRRTRRAARSVWAPNSRRACTASGSPQAGKRAAHSSTRALSSVNSQGPPPRALR